MHKPKVGPPPWRDLKIWNWEGVSLIAQWVEIEENQRMVNIIN